MPVRDLIVNNSGISLRGALVLPSGDGPWPLVVLCHGIPSGVTVEGDPGYEALARRLAKHKMAACFFNFRGTGLSDGNFSLPGWQSDLGSMLDAAEGAKGAFEAVDPSRIALMGFSGGGAVSIMCAAARGGLKALVVLSSPAVFSRIMPREDMVSFIAHARSIGIIRDKGFPPSEDDYYQEMLSFNPEEKIAGVAPTPLLIVHGDADDVVPVEEARHLYDAASEPKELHIVEGGGHKLRLNREAMEKSASWIIEKI
jgi:dipeptidyl aminopeptidase/acylaminoacyl peptidase